MGIYAAPPNRRRNRPPASDVLGWIAVALTIASVATFALVGGAGADSAWLAIALGEALLALARPDVRQSGILTRPLNGLRRPACPRPS